MIFKRFILERSFRINIVAIVSIAPFNVLIDVLHASEVHIIILSHLIFHLININFSELRHVFQNIFLGNDVWLIFQFQKFENKLFILINLRFWLIFFPLSLVLGLFFFIDFGLGFSKFTVYTCNSWNHVERLVD